MGNNKNPNQKQPGEKQPGTFHFNPGNMSGKTIGTNKDAPEQSGADRRHGADEQQDKAAGKARNASGGLKDAGRGK